ncbi:hypothetical protein DMC30DRAFT_399837 [Rhodotorula diobovata]|uniref:Uncharacterized protein n=1 Tax=Rhodotorula diobovata TaxID=5288 RepID=A0A5C5FVB9_9BASI|nr:hypothetical protein DMC30DRAFT_399837 [Rhodotorula diobovata]
MQDSARRRQVEKSDEQKEQGKAKACLVGERGDDTRARSQRTARAALVLFVHVAAVHLGRPRRQARHLEGRLAARNERQTRVARRGALRAGGPARTGRSPRSTRRRRRHSVVTVLVAIEVRGAVGGGEAVLRGVGAAPRRAVLRRARRVDHPLRGRGRVDRSARVGVVPARVGRRPAVHDRERLERRLVRRVRVRVGVPAAAVAVCRGVQRARRADVARGSAGTAVLAAKVSLVADAVRAALVRLLGLERRRVGRQELTVRLQVRPLELVDVVWKGGEDVRSVSSGEDVRSVSSGAL